MPLLRSIVTSWNAAWINTGELSRLDRRSGFENNDYPPSGIIQTMCRIVSIILTAALLLHFGLGCCVHHSHASEGNELSSALPTSGECSHHHGAIPRTNGNGPHRGPHEHYEIHSSCVFVLSAKPMSLNDHPQLWTAVVMTLASCKVALSAAAVITDVADFAIAANPVRLHLYHRQLLI